MPDEPYKACWSWRVGCVHENRFYDLDTPIKDDYEAGECLQCTDHAENVDVYTTRASYPRN